VNASGKDDGKKGQTREGKGGQPPSGGGNKKRLKSKKQHTGKLNSHEISDTPGGYSAAAQQF